MPEKKGFRSCSCDSFNERTRPGDSAWGVADAMAIAYELTGDEHFLDLAQMTYAYFIPTAGGMGKNYSIALVTSPQLIYKLHRAGRTDLSTGRWDEPFEALAPRVLPPGRPLRVLLRTTRPEAVEVSVAVAGQARNVTVPPGASWQAVELRPLPAGEPVALTLTSGAQAQACTVEVLAPGAAPVGEEVGLIAGQEDFLGPALPLLGVTAMPIAAGDDLARFGTILLGTQACTLDAAGIRSDPAPLLRWLHAGGTVVVSHPNDDNQDPFLFGPALVLQEENAVSGAIMAPEHALFRSPQAVADLSGATMFDSVAWADEAWEVLAADTAGRPAVLALTVGEGRVLVIVPSFERYVTGLLAASEAQVAGYRAFLENVVAWAQK